MHTERRPPSAPTFTWIYGVATLLALAILGVGIYRLAKDGGNDWTMIAAGGLALVAVAVTWPIALALRSRTGGAGTAAGPSSDGALVAKFDQVAAALNRI